MARWNSKTDLQTSYNLQKKQKANRILLILVVLLAISNIIFIIK
jgi:hypothetical protein